MPISDSDWSTVDHIPNSEHFSPLKTKNSDKRCHLIWNMIISLGCTVIQFQHLWSLTRSVVNNALSELQQLPLTAALSCHTPVPAAAPDSLCCLSPPGQAGRSPAQSCPCAGWCLPGHSMHLLAAHLLLPSPLRHFRSHGFWTASCVVPFSRKSVPIRPFLYQICLKLSNELISYWGRDQGNEQYVHNALFS